jgi:phytanoyl-CoA hydroxylase
MAALRAAGYTELPVKKGDLVLIHGKVDHLSLMNNSPISRHTFQLHLVESSPASQWRPTNWQQYDPMPKITFGAA